MENGQYNTNRGDLSAKEDALDKIQRHGHGDTNSSTTRGGIQDDRSSQMGSDQKGDQHVDKAVVSEGSIREKQGKKPVTTEEPPKSGSFNAGKGLEEFIYKVRRGTDTPEDEKRLVDAIANSDVSDKTVEMLAQKWGEYGDFNRTVEQAVYEKVLRKRQELAKSKPETRTLIDDSPELNSPLKLVYRSRKTCSWFLTVSISSEPV